MSDTLRVIPNRRNFDSILFDNNNLNITGNKTIAISASNHDMLDINQSLFLRIDGELSTNVMIQAQLNDSQSPITPDGDSRDISSLDEIYFKIYGRQYEVAFGDLDMNITGTQFMNFNPKYTGIRVSYFDRHSVASALAISNSKTAYINFSGIEARQGPYFLRPDNSPHNVQILPGTESIWLNGVALSRGTDYRIDYSEGSIEFFLNHFISSNSRIQASFQYSDEYYRKNSMLANAEARLSDRLRFRTAIVYQKDDKERPLSESLSDSDIEMLKLAGNSTPYVSGEIYIGDGLGLYEKVETPEYSSLNFIYIYSPGSENADYNVRFSWVGNGNGDYNQITPSRFDFVGINEGSYLPIREIIAPEHRANYNVSLNYQHDIFSLYGESLLSEHDINTFSEIDNENNISQIHHIQFMLFPDWDYFEPVLTTWYRYREKNLFTFADIRNPDEVYRFYNFAQPDSLNSNEIYMNLNSNIFNYLRQETQYKIVNFENKIEQNYLTMNQIVAQHGHIPAMRYRYSFSKNNVNEQNMIAKINIHEPEIEYKYKIATIRSNARYFENKISENYISTGTRLNSINSQLALDNIKNSGVAVAYLNENNFDNKEDDWLQSRQSDTYTFQTYTRWNRQILTALYSHRIVHNYTEDRTQEKFDIAEIRTSNSIYRNSIQLNGTYQLRNTEFYPRARELIYVGQGVGLYDSTGVYTENGEWDYETVIVGDPTKSIEVQAGINAYTYPANFLNRDHDLYDLLNRMNIETNINVLEQTENKDRIKVYFLFPSALMNEFSIYSQQEFRTSFWFNIQRNKLISRYTFRNNNTQDRRFQDLNTNNVTEHEISLRLLRIYNSDFETIYRQSLQNESRYNMDSDVKTGEFNIRTSLGNNLIFNTGLGYEKENVTSNSNFQIIDRYIISEDIMYFLGQKYRFNTNLSIRYNVIDNPINTYLPFDKQKGMNMRWMIAANYRMNRIATMNLDYSGYKHPTQDAFHQVRMEVRAEF